jgi:hypothetical protein
MRGTKKMNSTTLCPQAMVSILLCSTAAFGYAAGLPKSATVLDAGVEFDNRPYSVISPNGKWVAYTSKGVVRACSIAEPVPRRLFEASEAVTNALARPENASPSNMIGREPDGDSHLKLSNLGTGTVYGLHWTPNSDGVFFGIRSEDTKKRISTNDIWYAPVAGKPTNLARISRGFNDDELRGFVVDCQLTRDRRFLVLMGLRRPLIWDISTNKPRATCFLHLTPSATSGHWIGIEKDTRQLVITDEDFDVVKRFDETLPARSFGFNLDWSPDERFIVWRNQIGFDHYNNWDGFWMNVDTGEKRQLEGRFMDEQIVFTGRGGEFFRSGQDGVRSKSMSGDQITGAHLTIVPEGKGPPRDIWQIKVDSKGPKPGLLTNRPGNPPIRISPDGSLFAIGLPRPAGERSGVFWHLIDREGKTWRFPGDDNGEFVSPYGIVAFADGGRVIVAQDATRLFTIPVSTVRNEANYIK